MLHQRIWQAALTAALVIGCGSDEGDQDSTGCVPGRSVACTTTDGCDGAQECNAEGTYDACVCGATPSTGGSGGGGGPSGGSGGGSVVSGGSGGGAQAGSGSDTGGSSTGGSVSTGGVAVTCDPVDMSSWTPPAYVPAAPAQQVCSVAQIGRFYDDCLMGPDCSAFDVGGADAECGACMWPSPIDGSSYGPVLEVAPRPNYRWESNTAGCIEILGEAACAESIQAAQACAREACLDTCGAMSPGFNDCATRARTTVCQTYTAASACISSAATSAACGGNGFREIVLALGAIFCGEN